MQDWVFRLGTTPSKSRHFPCDFTARPFPDHYLLHVLQLVAAVLHNNQSRRKKGVWKGGNYPKLVYGRSVKPISTGGGGGQIMSTIFLRAPRIFRPSYGPVHLMSDLMLSTTRLLCPKCKNCGKIILNTFLGAEWLALLVVSRFCLLILPIN
jgi:hypothetical protein